MKRKRKDNDFLLFWNLVSDGEPANLNEIYDEVLTLSCIGLNKEIPFTRINNRIRVELGPNVSRITEIYTLIYSFKKSDAKYIDGAKDYTIDETAFEIVKYSDQQNEEGNINLVTEIKNLI